MIPLRFRFHGSPLVLFSSVFYYTITCLGRTDFDNKKEATCLGDLRNSVR